MKNSTIVIMALITLPAAGWLGMIIGIRIGTDIGRSDCHNLYAHACCWAASVTKKFVTALSHCDRFVFNTV